MKEKTTIQQLEKDLRIVIRYYEPSEKEINLCFENIKKKIKNKMF